MDLFKFLPKGRGRTISCDVYDYHLFLMRKLFSGNFISTKKISGRTISYHQYVYELISFVFN